jgi:hypothetical protein
VEQIGNKLSVSYSDRDINGLLEGIGDRTAQFTRHYSQNEDFFLKLERDFTVPHLPIHHDVREPKPDREYLQGLRAVISELAGLAPQVLKEMIYFFDPSEILRPCFFKVYRVEDEHYLYLLRIDLQMRPAEGTAIERGTNDVTPRYTSRKLFMEPLIIPLDDVLKDEGKVKGFVIKQTISETWIGEQGRGYMLHGIWMDLDLTRFFSRLFLPKGKKTYPFFPFICKFKTVCQSVIHLDPAGRRNAVPYLHRVIQFLLPSMARIQLMMKNVSFTEDMPFFIDFKARVPEIWYEPWRDIKVEAYLNESEMREFRVED